MSYTRKTTKREEAQLTAPLFSGTGNTLPPEMRFKTLHFLLPSGVRSSHTTSRRKTQYITHLYIYIYIHEALCSTLEVSHLSLPVRISVACVWPSQEAHLRLEL